MRRLDAPHDAPQRAGTLEMEIERTASRLRSETQQMQSQLKGTRKEIDKLSGQISGRLSKNLAEALIKGESLADTLRGFAQSTIRRAYNAALDPITDHLGGVLRTGIQSLLPFAKGARFSQGRVQPFASGGVVGAPTLFPMRGGGLGMMGEAGPEAILPLARGADGKLGVRSSAQEGRAIQVVVNISTPNMQSFQQSESQIAAQIGRALRRAQRNT